MSHRKARGELNPHSSIAANGYSLEGWRRWVPCMGMALCAGLSFADRQLLVVLAPTILLELGLTAQDFGNVTLCFFIAYTLGNPVWGSVIDPVGPRVGMIAAVGFWSAASSSHALTASVLGFGAARAVLGLGEGATFPGGLRTATDSLPPNLRGRGMAASFAGGAIGGIVTPLIAVPIALRFGWRSVFLLSGLFGLVWLILWAVIARPPFLPAFTRNEVKVRWPSLFERRFWALVSSYALPAVASGTNLTSFRSTSIVAWASLRPTSAESFGCRRSRGRSGQCFGDGSPTGTSRTTRGQWHSLAF